MEERVAIFVGADDSDAAELLVPTDVGVVLNELRAEAERFPDAVPETVPIEDTDTETVPEEDTIDDTVEKLEGEATLEALTELDSVG